MTTYIQVPKETDLERMARWIFEEQAHHYGYESLTWRSPALNHETFYERARQKLKQETSSIR